MSPISRRRGALRPAPPLVCRWDLDKTYLRSEFETIRQLLRTAFERGEDKVDVPGVVELIKVIREAADRRPQSCRSSTSSATSRGTSWSADGRTSSSARASSATSR